MDSSPITGVIFDLDGTLYYLSKTRVRLTFQLLTTIHMVSQMAGSRRKVRAERFEDADQMMEAFSEELARRAHVSPRRAAEWYKQTFMPAFIDLLDRRARPRPGLLPLLSALRERKIKLGVVSDFGQISERLRAVGVPPEAFDELLPAEEVGELKPSPKSLLKMVNHWGHNPSQVLMVGDRIDRDGEAARAAGMPCIIVENNPPLLGSRHRQGVTPLPWREARGAIARQTGLE